MTQLVIIDKKSSKVYISNFLEKVGTPEDLIEGMIERGELPDDEHLSWIAVDEVSIIDLR